MGYDILKQREYLGHSFKRVAGSVLRDDRLVSETLQCVVCGAHFEIAPEKPEKRGWNVQLKGFTCGQEACNMGIPNDRYLDMLERGISPVQALHEYESGTRYM